MGSSNFTILYNLWQIIQNAKLFSWPEEGIGLSDLCENKNHLDHFLLVAVPNFKNEKDKYFFPDAQECERWIINHILIVNPQNLISLFMSIHFDLQEDSALSTQDIYSLFLKWMRNHKINVAYAPKRTGFLHKLEELGYERCNFGNGTGIFGIALKHQI